MTLREHATKAVDYSIRVALISIVALPIAFCAWWFIGFGPGGEAPDPTSERISGIIGISGFVFVSPACLSAKLLAFAHVPADPLFGLVYLVVAVVSVPAFWGTVIYLVVQFFGYLRKRTGLTKRWRQPLTGEKVSA
jgi:hypothetical protein